MHALSLRYERTGGKLTNAGKWRSATAPKFVVLCYHRIGTGGIPFFSWLEPEVFAAQIRFITGRYPVLSLDRMLQELKNPSGIRQAVVITFDDGYRGVYTEAFPILRDYDVPVTVYLPASCIETGTVPWYDRVFLALQILDSDAYQLLWDPSCRFSLSNAKSRVCAAEQVVMRLRSLPDESRQAFCSELERSVALPDQKLADRMLTWSQISEMQDSGVHFGAHTLSHPVISRLNAFEMERQLSISKELLESRLGREIADFAYPFGQVQDCGSDATPVLKRLGYRSAVTTCTGTNTPFSDLYSLRRVSVGASTSLPKFAFNLTRMFLTGEDCSPLQSQLPSVRETAVAFGGNKHA
jgi:peptidoglycan/xylan/chitin deacetylase (PgdA/CDA1 family)